MSAKEMSSKMASALCQNCYKKTCLFCPKTQNCVVWTIRFCSNFTSTWYRYFLRNARRDLRLPMSAVAKVARKSFNGKFTAKIDFLIGHFVLPLLMLALESKVSPYII